MCNCYRMCPAKRRIWIRQKALDKINQQTVGFIVAMQIPRLQPNTISNGRLHQIRIYSIVIRWTNMLHVIPRAFKGFGRVIEWKCVCVYSNHIHFNYFDLSSSFVGWKKAATHCTANVKMIFSFKSPRRWLMDTGVFLFSFNLLVCLWLL